ncbi:protein FAR1-RELATED SEQUENCE 5-like [Salvia hispanica]|uniref:protein FAR1-RELATED SEQUENCE 5-like n=1 Tax=Salvia hispanica TaxID=49212 RepID=UPI0020098EDF|nr:protein FAR1-RELATED SEQUENCE 5-like [Salvia hispanica]
MGIAPKMIVTDQDLGMRSAIEEILVGTRHRWCMWHIMHKLANKVPGRLLRDGDFKKEFNACVWSDLLEPDEFEEEWNGVLERYGLEDHGWLKTLYDYRQLWIPAYFRDFPLGSTIRTTSISESENSFYKNFLKPRNNIAEFYLNFNQALEFQRDRKTKLDYQDANALPILATTLPFKKHASTMYTDSMFKKIQEEIVEGNDRCRVLGFSSVDMVDNYKLGDNLRNSYFVRHDKSDESYSCYCKLFGRQGYLCSRIFFLFRNNEVKKIPDQYCASRWMKTPLVKAVHGQFDDTLPTKAIVDERPEVVEVHPPDVVKTKGHASSSASRLISKREKAIKDATRPLRRCKACDELGHHDSRNCPMLKELEKEKEQRKKEEMLFIEVDVFLL